MLADLDEDLVEAAGGRNVGDGPEVGLVPEGSLQATARRQDGRLPDGRVPGHRRQDVRVHRSEEHVWWTFLKWNTLY